LLPSDFAITAIAEPGKARQQRDGRFFVLEHLAQVPADTDVIFGRALGDLYRHLAPSLSSVVAKHDGVEEIYLRQDLTFVPGSRQCFLGPVPAAVEIGPVLQPPTALIASTDRGASDRNTLVVAFAGMEIPIRARRPESEVQPLRQLVRGRPRRPAVAANGPGRVKTPPLL
jgi:hypothetical protein